MYLSKQWHESRIISGLAALALLLLLFLAFKATGEMRSANFHRDSDSGIIVALVPLFYIEAGLVGFWGWLAGGIGAGKNLGEESGSFLFTRPRRRAWFLWNDWGFAMAQIAAIILATNLILGYVLARITILMNSPGIVQMGPESEPLSLTLVMLVISLCVLLFAGLIYGLTYLCTILIKRASGVMLCAGILVAYVVFRGLMHHYYQSVHLPNLIIDLFKFDQHSVYIFSDHLGLSLVARTVAMLLFPLAAQVVLERSEI
jgi:hypothetical protein